MQPRTRVLPVLLLAFCLGAASAADQASTTSTTTPSRSLLGSQLGYVPSGCPLTVSISAEESQPSWFQDAPEIRGAVTLSNPTSYNVPLTSIIVQARSSDGMQYNTVAYCNGNSAPVVPYNPVPYTYGTLTCRYRLVLDRNVFGRYGQSSGNRKLLGNVQANFFPGSSSGGSSDSGSSGSSSGGGGYGYFPPPNQRASWTVTAIVSVRFSNAQCLSAPTPVNTDCWWNWLVSWHQRNHHKISWLFSGRKLLMKLAGGPSTSGTAQQELRQSAGEDVASNRVLLHSGHGAHAGHGGVSGELDGYGYRTASLSDTADAIGREVNSMNGRALLGSAQGGRGGLSSRFDGYGYRTASLSDTADAIGREVNSMNGRALLGSAQGGRGGLSSRYEGYGYGLSTTADTADAIRSKVDSMSGNVGK